MGSGRRIRGAEDDLAGWLAMTLSGGGVRGARELLPAQRCFDAPPAEQSSVDRPAARSQHRKRCGDGAGQQAHQWMLVNSQNLRDLDQGDDRASQRRPQADHEKKSRYDE